MGRVTPKEQKAELRNQKLALRDAMPAEQRIEASLAMADHAGDIIAFEPGAVISGFWPIRSEADIRPLMARLAERGARLCLPVVLDRETIVFRELVRGAPLVKTGFGTTGPGPEAAPLDPEILLLTAERADDEQAALDRLLQLLPDVPAGKLAIAELADASREDVEELERAGVDAVLVSGDVEALVGDGVPDV